MKKKTYLTNYKCDDPSWILLGFPPYKYIYNNENIWVKEKPKSFNNKTCLIIKIRIQRFVVL